MIKALFLQLTHRFFFIYPHSHFPPKEKEMQQNYFSCIFGMEACSWEKGHVRFLCFFRVNPYSTCYLMFLPPQTW